MKRSKRPRQIKKERGFRQAAKQGQVDETTVLVGVFDDIDEKVYVADPVTHQILYANAAMKKLFGEKVEGKKCHQVMQGLDKPCDFCTNPLIFGENMGKTYIWEFQNLKTKKWRRCIDKAIRWIDGRMVRFEMAIDIHDRKIAEDAVRRSEEKYRQLVENINEVIYSIDKAGTVTYVSPAIQSLTGYSPSEIVGLHFSNFIHKDDFERIVTRYGEALSGQEKASEYRILTKSGEARWVRTFSRPVYLENAVIGLQGVLADITEYKEAQVALKESEERYRQLVETMNEGLTITDEKGIRTYANRKACKILGYELHEMVNRPPTDFLDERGQRIWREGFEKRKRGDSSPYEITWTRKDGKQVSTLVSPRPIFDEKGAFKGSFSVITDITGLKKAEEAVRERERELSVKTKDLEEMNTALRVLLQRREKDKEELEEKILLNLKELVNPYLDKLKKSIVDQKERTYLDILEANLRSITSSFSSDLHFKYLNLTPTELRIASLIREGRTSKETADLMSLSPRTIESHRKNIRRKMGLTAKKQNLRTLLLEVE